MGDRTAQNNPWKDIAIWYKSDASLQTVATLCIDDHQFVKDDFETEGKLANVCALIVLKCLYIARFRRPIYNG